MVNLLLTNDSLKRFIKELKINKEDKSFLLSEVPQLDEEERIKLLETLKEIYLLDLEEKKALERIKKYWKK